MKNEELNNKVEIIRQITWKKYSANGVGIILTIEQLVKEVDKVEARVAELEEELRKNSLELQAIEALEPFIAGTVEGQHAAYVGIQELIGRFEKMNHIRSVEEALEYALSEVENAGRTKLQDMPAACSIREAEARVAELKKTLEEALAEREAIWNDAVTDSWHMLDIGKIIENPYRLVIDGKKSDER